MLTIQNLQSKIQDKITSIQESKSDEEKLVYAFLIAVLVAIFIFALWFISSRASFNFFAIDQNAQKATATDAYFYDVTQKEVNQTNKDYKAESQKSNVRVVEIKI